MQPTTAPAHCSHKPIVAVNDYAIIDEPKDGDTDAVALSLGWAGYDGNAGAIAAKVWRYVSGRWSRQGEELPLHRVLDLAILITNEMSRADGKKVTEEGHQTTIFDEGAMPELADFLSRIMSICSQGLKS